MKNKDYEKGNLTVHWKPDLCIHSAVCVKGLPSVFNAKVQPWIKPEGATETEIRTQIDKCPSGALSYSLKAD